MLDFTKNFIPFLEQLEINKVPYEVHCCADGMKILFKDGSDVALNSYTYGHEEGLLEGYKGKFISYYDDEFTDEVTGYLTYNKALELMGL